MKTIGLDFAQRRTHSIRKMAILSALDAFIQGITLLAFLTLCAGVFALLA